jgi:hypothetical protein
VGAIASGNTDSTAVHAIVAGAIAALQHPGKEINLMTHASVVAITVGMAMGMAIGNTVAIAVHAISRGAIAAHQLACRIGGVWQVNCWVA